MLRLRNIYNRPSYGLVLGQRLRRLTGIEPAMGCDAGQTPEFGGQAYILCTRYILGKYWMKLVVEGIHVEDIF